jgi:hypothetical protein
VLVDRIQKLKKSDFAIWIERYNEVEYEQVERFFSGLLDILSEDRN